jgi:hypothetical protein
MRPAARHRSLFGIRSENEGRSDVLARLGKVVAVPGEHDSSSLAFTAQATKRAAVKDDFDAAGISGMQASCFVAFERFGLLRLECAAEDLMAIGCNGEPSALECGELDAHVNRALLRRCSRALPDIVGLRADKEHDDERGDGGEPAQFARALRPESGKIGADGGARLSGNQWLRQASKRGIQRNRKLAEVERNTICELANETLVKESRAKPTEIVILDSVKIFEADPSSCTDIFKRKPDARARDSQLLSDRLHRYRGGGPPYRRGNYGYDTTVVSFAKLLTARFFTVPVSIPDCFFLQ